MRQVENYLNKQQMLENSVSAYLDNHVMDFKALGARCGSTLSQDFKTEKKAIRNLSLIDDPLWKTVCEHIMDSMGSASVLSVWDCQLGELSSQDSCVDIHCQSQRSHDFLERYAFVILGTLRKYFPNLDSISITTENDNCSKPFSVAAQAYL